MRKYLFFFGPASVLALGALVACESDPPGGGSTPELDSGLPDSNPPPHTDGGGGPDATPDAPEVPGVNVTVFGYGGPKAGVRVVFHDATGAVMETKLTGPDGKAKHIGETPAMASALLSFGESRRIVTWTGVELGDDLQVLDREEDDHIGMYSITLPGEPDGGANTYTVESECDRNLAYGTAAELPLYRSCTRPKNAVLATALSRGDLRGYAFKKGNAAVTDGGTGAFTLGAWVTPTPFTVDVTNLPPETFYEASLLEVADGAGFRNYESNQEGATITYGVAPGFADAYQASISFADSGRDRRVAKRVAPGTPSTTLDYDAILPEIEGAELDATNPQRPIVSWTSAAPLTTTDGGVIHVRFDGPQERTFAWTFVVPGNATTVTAPAMPPEAESFLPPAPDSGTETYFYLPRVMFIEGDAIPSYAAFRRQQGLFLDHTTSFNGRDLPVLPANGAYRTTSWDAVPR